MKNLKLLIVYLIICVIAACIAINHKQPTQTTSLHAKYLTDSLPGMTPQLFAPKIVSTGMSEINSAFTPDFKTFFFSIRMPNRQLVIMQMKHTDKGWSLPQVASFSGKYSDADPFVSYDGKWLYFISKRPINADGKPKKDWDIWRTPSTTNGWGNPERLNSDINSDKDETYPNLTTSGKLYFASSRQGKNNKDIFCAEACGDDFKKAKRLDDIINEYWEGDNIIAPNEDYIIFGSYGRPEGSGLYIAFRKDNQWQKPQRMNDDINMTGREFCPILTPDGKYFFFTSAFVPKPTDNNASISYQSIKNDFLLSSQLPQKGKSDIYWVSSSIIDKYRK